MTSGWARRNKWLLGGILTGFIGLFLIGASYRNPLSGTANVGFFMFMIGGVIVGLYAIRALYRWRQRFFGTSYFWK